MLTDRIVPLDTSNDPEDYLSTSLGVIFPDDITNQHGDASCPVIYKSPLFGDIVLQMADPEAKNTRLFSHHLWNAGVQLAALIEDSDSGAQSSGERELCSVFGDGLSWSVAGERVLELGAGSGLTGIIAAKAGAEEVVISDYPAPEVLRNILVNVERNLGHKGHHLESDGSTDASVVGGKRTGNCSVVGHEWGRVPDGFETKATDKEVEEMRDRANESPPDLPLPSPDLFTAQHKHHFTRLLVADCLWMLDQHANLQRSISYFLHHEGRAWVIAGFHTGRAKLSNFFREEELREKGLEVERIWERDAEGHEREWVVDRGVEDVTGRKRWLVVAVLRRIGVQEGAGAR
jgi:nicotinamide N-methyltransferase